MRLLLLGGGLFLGSVILPLAGYSQGNIQVLVDRLTVGGNGIVSATPVASDTTTPIQQKFRQIGKSAIPYLIEAIDEDQTGLVGNMNPLNSNLQLNLGNHTAD